MSTITENPINLGQALEELEQRIPAEPQGYGLKLNFSKPSFIDILKKQGWKISREDLSWNPKAPPSKSDDKQHKTKHVINLTGWLPTQTYKLRKGDTGLKIRITVCNMGEACARAMLDMPTYTTSMMTALFPGPENLGDLAVLLCTMPRYHRDGGLLRWVNRNVFVEFADHDMGATREEQLRVAKIVNQWLSKHPVANLKNDTPLITNLAPNTDKIVEGETVRFSWEVKTSKCADFEIKTDKVGMKWLYRRDQGKNFVKYKGGGTGAADIYIWAIDLCNFQVSEAHSKIHVVDFEEKYGTLDDTELASLLDPERLYFSWLIVEQLKKNVQDNWSYLVKTVDWYNDEPTKQKKLIVRLWQVDQARAVLLKDATFQKRLPQLILTLPQDLPGPSGSNTKERNHYRHVFARKVFAELTALGQHQAIRQIAGKLPEHVSITTWKSIGPAFHALNDHQGAIDLQKKFLKHASPDTLEVILFNSNIALELMALKYFDDAEVLLKRIITQYRGRFPGHLKGSLVKLRQTAERGDRQAAQAFVYRNYYAVAHYNLACLYAQTRRPQLALEVLKVAIKSARENYTPSFLLQDKDLRPLNGLMGFMKIVDTLRSNASQSE